VPITKTSEEEQSIKEQFDKVDDFELQELEKRFAELSKPVSKTEKDAILDFINDPNKGIKTLSEGGQNLLNLVIDTKKNLISKLEEIRDDKNYKYKKVPDDLNRALFILQNNARLKEGFYISKKIDTTSGGRPPNKPYAKEFNQKNVNSLLINLQNNISVISPKISKKLTETETKTQAKTKTVVAQKAPTTVEKIDEGTALR
jgi:hypothetical protein